MKNIENEFETLVRSIRFDDTPSETHRRQLEEQLLAAYDGRACPDAVRPGCFYVKRLAIAAGFLVAAGLLFLVFDETGPGPNGHPAHAPDARTVEDILRREKAAGTPRQDVLAEIQQAWTLIAAEDVAGLTGVVLDDAASHSVRLWAGEALAKLGDAQTLGVLERHIAALGLTEAEDPVVFTADRLRHRLDAGGQ